MRKLLIGLLGLIALTVAVVGSVGADEPELESPDSAEQSDVGVAFMEVGGVESTLRTGQRLTVAGAYQVTGGCWFPETEIGGVLGGNQSSGKIILVFESDCSITVQEVAFSEAEPLPGVALSSTEERFGWAHAALRDILDWELTEVYVEMYYWDNGEHVYSGHNPDYYCDVFSYPFGWYIESCRSWWWPIGRDQVHIRGKGEFAHSSLDADHWQEAKYTGTPGRGRYTCRHEGHVPTIPGLPIRWECEGEEFG